MATIIKRFLLSLLLITPCHAAPNQRVVETIEKMLPTLPPEGKRRAEAILALVCDDNYEKIWEQVQKQQAQKQPVSLQMKRTLQRLAKAGFTSLEHFSQFLQTFCTIATALHRMGTSGQELYSLFAHGTVPQGGRSISWGQYPPTMSMTPAVPVTPMAPTIPPAMPTMPPASLSPPLLESTSIPPLEPVRSIAAERPWSSLHNRF